MTSPIAGEREALTQFDYLLNTLAAAAEGPPMTDHTTSGLPQQQTVEAVAKAIYQQWESQPGYKPWVERGNSIMQDKARDIARAALAPLPVAPKAEQAATQAEAKAQEMEPIWPKLDKPASVGGGTFGAGVSSKYVVHAAQRQYEHDHSITRKTPAELQEEEANRRTLWDMIHGAPSQEPVVTVYRGGLGGRWGKATVVRHWEAGAANLPDGEHKLYAAPTAPTGAQAEPDPKNFLERWTEVIEQAAPKAEATTKGIPTEVGIAWQAGNTWPNERKAVTVDGHAWYRHDHPSVAGAQPVATDTAQPWTLEHLRAYPTDALAILNKLGAKR